MFRRSFSGHAAVRRSSSPTCRELWPPPDSPSRGLPTRTTLSSKYPPFCPTTRYCPATKVFMYNVRRKDSVLRGPGKGREPWQLFPPSSLLPKHIKARRRNDPIPPTFQSLPPRCAPSAAPHRIISEGVCRRCDSRDGTPVHCLPKDSVRVCEGTRGVLREDERKLTSWMERKEIRMGQNGL